MNGEQISPLAGQLSRALPCGLAGVIFDCDGVLLDSEESNTRFYNLARAYFGLPPMSKAQEEFVHMHTSSQSLEHVIPPGFMGRLREAVQSIDYVRDVIPYIRAEPGIYDLLQFLRGVGVKLAVHTNRSTFADDLLERFHLKEYFNPIVTASSCAPKPAPEGALFILQDWGIEPDMVMFVGDSRLDAQTAQSANLVFASFKNPDLESAVPVPGFGQMLAALKEFFTMRRVIHTACPVRG